MYNFLHLTNIAFNPDTRELGFWRVHHQIVFISVSLMDCGGQCVGGSGGAED